MSIKLIKNQSKLPKKQDGSVITLCDDVSQEFAKNDLREEKVIELKDLKKFFDSFNAERAKLPAGGFKDKVLLGANFLVDDIQLVLEQNKGNLSFLRLYLGIDENGDHILCLAPVDKSKKVIIKTGTYYVTQCCGYPPHTANFKGDPILGL